MRVKFLLEAHSRGHGHGGFHNSRHSKEQGTVGYIALRLRVRRQNIRTRNKMHVRFDDSDENETQV